MKLFDIAMKQLLHLLVSWKSARYLNLMNARLSHAEPISLRLYSFLVDFASAQAHMRSIVKQGYHQWRN